MDEDMEMAAERVGVEVVRVEGQAVERHEVDCQIATAKRFPRSIERFLRNARSMATADEESAAKCFYRLERSGKPIVGPSIRMAEILLSEWGNLKYATRLVAIEEDFVKVEGSVWDLERNVQACEQITRRIKNKGGQRFNQDMIQVTIGAAQSLALRNATMRVIPRLAYMPVLHAARQVICGDAKTFINRRQAALAYLSKVGVSSEMVFAHLGIAGEGDLDEDCLVALRAIIEQAKAGEVTYEAAFAPPSEAKARTLPKMDPTPRPARTGEPPLQDAPVRPAAAAPKKPPVKGVRHVLAEEIMRLAATCGVVVDPETFAGKSTDELSNLREDLAMAAEERAALTSEEAGDA